MTEEQEAKLHEILKLLRQNQGFEIKYTYRVTGSCPMCHQQRTVHRKDGLFSAADLAELMVFLIEHVVAHTLIPGSSFVVATPIRLSFDDNISAMGF